MGGRCTFGFLSMHCASVGPVTGVFFGLFMLCVLSLLGLTVMIDGALMARHPKERDDVRLELFTAYQFYVWKDRGLALGDEKLTKLLIRYRSIQLAAVGIFILIGCSAYLGF